MSLAVERRPDILQGGIVSPWHHYTKKTQKPINGPIAKLPEASDQPIGSLLFVVLSSSMRLALWIQRCAGARALTVDCFCLARVQAGGALHNRSLDLWSHGQTTVGFTMPSSRFLSEARWLRRQFVSVCSISF